MKPDQLLRSILPEVLIYNFDIDRFEKSESRSNRAFPTTIWGQAESTVHMLNWAVGSVKFLGVEFDQSEDEEVSVSDTTHL